MGKYQNDAMLDAALNYIKNNTTQMMVCSSQPTDYADAVSKALATKTGMSGSDIAIADGAVSGRKFTVSQQAGISIATSGNGNHIALCSADILLFVTTCVEQALIAGNTLTVPAWSDTIPDVA